MNSRWSVVGWIVLAALAFLYAQSISLPLIRTATGHVLTDPDGYMHWRLVQRALNGEGVRIRWMNEDNAPYGRMNEWTSPTTIYGVTLTRMLEICGGLSREQALSKASLWFGPVMGLAAIIVLGWLGWEAGGAVLAAYWLLAWPVLGEVLHRTEFGCVGHRSIHQFLFLGMVGGCLAFRKQQQRWGGIFVGLLSALAFWSGGSELLPGWILVAGLAVYENYSGGDPKRDFWRSWWVSGAVGTTLALLFEFWPHPFHNRLEFLSMWHVSLWLIMGGLIEGRERFQNHRVLAISVGGLAALVVAGVIRGFDWAHLHVQQDPRFQVQEIMTREFASVLDLGWGEWLHRAWMGYGALPLGILLLRGRWGKLEVRERWLMVALGLMLGLSLYQQRWQIFFVVTLVLAVGSLVRQGWPERAGVCAVVILAATLPAWTRVMDLRENVARIGGNALLGPQATAVGLETASDCFSKIAPGSVVLAPWDEGGVLAGLGKVRVVASGYWSNLDGLFVGYELYTTASMERFQEIVRKRSVQYVLTRSPLELQADIRLSFVALAGRIPSQEEVEATALWRVVNDRHAAMVPCEALRQIMPEWRIVRLP